MASLYEISDKLSALIEEAFDIETGEIYDSQEELDKAIDACELDLDTKLENIGCYIKNLEADVEAFKREEDNLYKRRKSAENKIESLKRYLNGYLSACYPNEEDKAKWRFKSPRVVLGFRKSTTVEVPNLEELDKDFIKIKTETSADKKAIKEAITSGHIVKGAYLKQNVNLSVK